MPDMVPSAELLSPGQLSRAERLRLNTRRRFTNRSRGEHLRGRGGSSTEFSDHRDYHEGDDIRHVDWNIFARLRRPYLKVFQQEEEMHVVVLLDASASMAFGGKFDLARRLAAALGVIGLAGQERVSAWTFGPDNEPRHCPPGTGRAARDRLLRFLETAETGSTLPPDAMVERALALHRGRGALVLVSDFLAEADFAALFNRVHSAGLEPLALQILAPEELDPLLTDDARLEDAETGALLDVTAGDDLLRAYHDRLDALRGWLATLTRQRGGLYACVAADRSLETVLAEDLLRKGWLTAAR